MRNVIELKSLFNSDDFKEDIITRVLEKYKDKTVEKRITYENKPIDAFFHSNSGGITEVPVNVWGGTGYPYLQSVETSGENRYTQYVSEVTLSQEELINKLKEKYSDISIDFTNSEDIKILEELQRYGVISYIYPW